MQVRSSGMQVRSSGMQVSSSEARRSDATSLARAAAARSSSAAAAHPKPHFLIVSRCAEWRSQLVRSERQRKGGPRAALPVTCQRTLALLTLLTTLALLTTRSALALRSLVLLLLSTRPRAPWAFCPRPSRVSAAAIGVARRLLGLRLRPRLLCRRLLPHLRLRLLPRLRLRLRLPHLLLPCLLVARLRALLLTRPLDVAALPRIAALGALLLP